MTGQKQIDQKITVSLREITQDTVRQILKLDVSEAQKKYVASNAVSIAQAYFEPNAWFRAIYADATPVGFLMLALNRAKGICYLWRFMIDERYQGLGYGRRALHLAIDYAREATDAEIITGSYSPGEHSAASFYHKFGFWETGEIDEGEVVIKYKLR